ncbi:hypothetical protein D3C74_54270 [compost metagenome]
MDISQSQLIQSFLDQSSQYTGQTVAIRIGILKDEWYCRFKTEMPVEVQESLYSAVHKK